MGKDKEIRKLKQQLARYKNLSYKDSLTNLWNRRKLKQDIKRYKSLRRRFGIKFLLIMIDINKFKEINDTKGHKFGDNILKKIAKKLIKNIRNYENVYRISGDEFVMIISHYKNYEIIIRRIKRILKHININASIGICKIEKNNCLDIADKNMYKNKRKK